MWPLDVPPYRTLLKYAKKKKKKFGIKYYKWKTPRTYKIPYVCPAPSISGQIYSVSSQYIQWGQNKNVEL